MLKFPCILCHGPFAIHSSEVDVLLHVYPKVHSGIPLWMYVVVLWYLLLWHLQLFWPASATIALSQLSTFKIQGIIETYLLTENTKGVISNLNNSCLSSGQTWNVALPQMSRMLLVRKGYHTAVASRGSFSSNRKKNSLNIASQPGD